ncbi:SGNH/GDSL hydrolase family protein [Henriciella marina]|uniref:SGNH/GDSL hydrolase family protein n=1 Tax=Henriciella marina TaxID=453851 RepID=UPI0012EAC4D4|nr:SGNH/GDSL hydrolase family protein [Henriciella marina]
MNRLFETSGKGLFALHAGSADDGDAVDALFDLIGEREDIRFAMQDSGPRPSTARTLSALASARLDRLSDQSARGLVLTSATSSVVVERFDWSRPVLDEGRSPNDVVKSVARERRVPCFDFARLMRELGLEFGEAALFQVDGVHLSLAGRLVLFGAVFKGLTGDMPALESLAADLAEGWSQAGTDEALSASDLPGFARRAAQMIGAMD